ncbi:ABC transporter ATP-binding protein [Isoptericola sp. b490]|uniref:ABC transporter ATP-binding protein n=1 Tax=Actinotalea lenta TaxID=3064654 RepID=UPI002712D6EC|nr:ABC transporter ATP-binding protein [Isoptericola sp. b490]MDO8122463.1 ABC transporter ATP-binding protein [Isoptericola sp. b490]
MRAAGTPDVVVHGLRKSYGTVRAVADVSFEVERGEVLGILGPNGSGKTTTVECLQGLRRPDGGDLTVLGLDPRTQVRQLRRLIGSQLQDAALPDRLRVVEAVRLFASVGEGRADVDALLADWGLAAKRSAAFGTLSGGQRQRLFIALALVNRPRLVFLDEMTTGLDPEARREAWRLIARLRELGTTVVLVTHFLDEAERLCDRLVVVRDGAVVAAGTPAELVAAHGGGVTATFTADLDDAELGALPGVTSVGRRGRAYEVRGDAAALLHLGHLLVGRGTVPTDLRVHQPTLEDAYLALVGAERR